VFVKAQICGILDKSINSFDHGEERQEKSPKKLNVNNYYGVSEGRIPGIYTSWAACNKQVTGHSGACHGGFIALDECVEFMLSNTDNTEIDITVFGERGKQYTIPEWRAHMDSHDSLNNDNDDDTTTAKEIFTTDENDQDDEDEWEDHNNSDNSLLLRQDEQTAVSCKCNCNGIQRQINTLSTIVKNLQCKSSQPSTNYDHDQTVIADLKRDLRKKNTSVGGIATKTVGDEK
jgi:hypothetical protein